MIKGGASAQTRIPGIGKYCPGIVLVKVGKGQWMSTGDDFASLQRSDLHGVVISSSENGTCHTVELLIVTWFLWHPLLKMTKSIEKVSISEEDFSGDCHRWANWNRLLKFLSWFFQKTISVTDVFAEEDFSEQQWLVSLVSTKGQSFGHRLR
jgi:hypothetical protein